MYVTKKYEFCFTKQYCFEQQQGILYTLGKWLLDSGHTFQCS